MRNKHLLAGLLICGVAATLLIAVYEAGLLSTIIAQRTITSGSPMALTENETGMSRGACGSDRHLRPATSLSKICPLLSPEFGRLVKVKAKIVSANNKSGDVLLDVYECNGTCVRHVVMIDSLSLNVRCHIGETCEISGYESIEVDGIPREILARRRIQAKEYSIANSFVILDICSTNTSSRTDRQGRLSL